MSYRSFNKFDMNFKFEHMKSNLESETGRNVWGWLLIASHCIPQICGFKLLF